MAEVMLEKFPFISIDSLSSLQSIASTELAFNLWRYKYFNQSSNPNDNEFSFLKMKFSCDEMLFVPPLINNMINKKIELIGVQMIEWMNFHKIAMLFDGNFRDVFPKCLCSIVLSPNGEINYKRTASNLVKGSELNDVEKYKIACFLCLEDDVKRIWPSVSNNPLVTDDRRIISRKDSSCAMSSFLYALEGNCVVASEYFFEMLSYNQKIFKASDAIMGADKFNNELKLRLLRRLDMNQARYVFKIHGWKIISILINHDEYLCHLYNVWVSVKDAALENPRHFFEILRGLWITVFNEIKLDFEARKSVNNLLIDAWAGAPDNFKSYIANYRMGEFFSGLSAHRRGFPLSKIYGHDMTFMLQLFDSAEYEIRNLMWQKNWRKLVLRAQPHQLEKFMKSSLPDDESVENFKRSTLLKFSTLYKSFIEEGLYSDFINYLRFFIKDPKLIQDQSKRTLKLNVDLIISADSNKLNRFETFVGEIFANKSKEAAKFKEQMLLSKKGMHCLNETFERTPLKDFVKIVSSLIPSDRTLKKLKKKFFEYRCHRLTQSNHNINRYHLFKWTKLLEWCIADVEQIATLEKSFNADAMMVKLIHDIESGRKDLRFKGRAISLKEFYQRQLEIYSTYM